MSEGLSEQDAARVASQLGRPVRGAVGVAHRCPCGAPDVVTTAPRLPDGTPFPTLFYLCCSSLNSTIGRMEAGGVMREMTDELAADPDLAAAYRSAHESYLAMRNAIDDLGIPVTAGGMPDRVKCLHVLVAHALAVGRGVNPLGDRAVDMLGDYVRGGAPCARLSPSA
jgi:hypothetical protein